MKFSIKNFKDDRILYVLGVLVFLLFVLILITERVRTNTFTLSEASTPMREARLHFSPPYDDGGMKVDVLLDTYNNPVSGVDVRILFDPTDVEVLGVEKHPGSPFSSYPAERVDSGRGQIIIGANIGPSLRASPVRGDYIKIASVAYELAGEPVSEPFVFDFTPGERNDSNVVYMPENRREEPSDILTSVGVFGAIPPEPPAMLKANVRAQEPLLLRFTRWLSRIF